MQVTPYKTCLPAGRLIASKKPTYENPNGLFACPAGNGVRFEFTKFVT